MLLAVIIDALATFLLVMFAIYGSWRGLFRSLIGFVGAAVALVGAGYLANALMEPVMDRAIPTIEEYVEQKLEEAIQKESADYENAKAQAEANVYSLEELLELLGLDEDLRASLQNRIEDRVQSAEENLVAAVVNSVAETVIYGILYLLSFVVLMLLVKLVSFLLNGVLKLPVLNTANTVGGMLIGLMEGVLLMFLAIWVMRHFGCSFETGVLAHTHILKFFTSFSPLSALTFLR